MVAGILDPARQPQTLQVFMEQASHFDIASLLSSLHQLKEENLGLEDSVYVYRLIARRDHLLAVQARLLALNSLAEPRREQQVGNGPSSSNDRRLVSLVSPSRNKSRSQDCDLEKSVWIGKKYEGTCSDRY